jgi:hypothetical protein
MTARENESTAQKRRMAIRPEEVGSAWTDAGVCHVEEPRRARAGSPPATSKGRPTATKGRPRRVPAFRAPRRSGHALPDCLRAGCS